MPKLTSAALVGLFITFPCGAFAEDTPASRLLLVTKTQDDLPLFLPMGTRLLRDSVEIEKFLEELDSAPPDWAEIHGKYEQAREPAGRVTRGAGSGSQEISPDKTGPRRERETSRGDDWPCRPERSTDLRLRP